MPSRTMNDLTAFVAKTLKLKEAGPESGMGRTRGWDSLAHVNLILALEDWAGVSVPPELMGELSTVTAIAGYLREQGVLGA